MALTSLRHEFGIAVASGEPAIRVDTDELDDAIRTIGEVCKAHGWEMRLWDKTVGTQWVVGEPPRKKNQPQAGPGGLSNAGNSGVVALTEFWEEQAYPDPGAKGETRPVVYVLKNFHLLFERERETAVSLVQHLISDKVQDLKGYPQDKSKYEASGIGGDSETGKFIVGLCVPDAKLAPEIAPLFKRIAHDPPDETELGIILDGIILPAEERDDDDDDEDEPQQKLQISAETRKAVCKYALGLTRSQATGVFSAAVLQFGNDVAFEEKFPKYVWQAKSDILNKEGLVTLYTGTETFADVVGQTGLKALLKGLLAPDKYDPENPDLRSKGLCLVGPPRTGKSLTSKAAGNELGLPTLMVDVGALFGGIVGDTERNTRRCFQVIRAHAPCIAVIDEVEKTMPSGRGGDHDSGVSKRMAGSFMTNLQDIKEFVFWVFTANSTEELHEAFLADDRVDAVVYVHMPGPKQLADGWRRNIQQRFPKQFKGGEFALAKETDFTVAFERVKKAKNPDINKMADYLLPSLMCVPEDEREAHINAIRSANVALAERVEEIMIDDSGWTIARVKSCCRMARKLDRTLTEVARMMPRKQAKLLKAIEKLERWADGEAIDAETGMAYSAEVENEEGETISPTKKTLGKVKRTVRTSRDRVK